jgi:hypothetical protein
VYYFASPHIDANRSPDWSRRIFEQLSAIYLEAFSNLVNLYCAAEPAVRFFYPSSIYVEQPERGFAEYAAAKGAGEALCVQLAQRYPKAAFHAPRLPRMTTDQTASIVAIKSSPVLDVMLEELARFRAID